MVHQELQNSDYRIRKLVGILGLLLPIILVISKGEFLASISHYYYSTLSSLFFIIILSSFGLFLLSYKGYKKDVTSEKISDDFITNIGGLAALIVVFIPTRCADSTSVILEVLCKAKDYPLFGHNCMIKSGIHLGAAGIFVLAMGWMSKYKFTRSDSDPNNKLYRFCGNVVFLSVGLIILLIILEKLGANFKGWFFRHYVFILETAAVIAFGSSWLVKGKVIGDMKQLMKRFM